MATWVKLDSGDWGVRVDDPTYHHEHMVGFPITVYKHSGERAHVVLGAFVRQWRKERGRFVYVFEVDDEGTAKIAKDWTEVDARFNARIRRANKARAAMEGGE